MDWTKFGILRIHLKYNFPDRCRSFAERERQPISFFVSFGDVNNSLFRFLLDFMSLRSPAGTLDFLLNTFLTNEMFFVLQTVIFALGLLWTILGNKCEVNSGPSNTFHNGNFLELAWPIFSFSVTFKLLLKLGFISFLLLLLFLCQMFQILLSFLLLLLLLPLLRMTRSSPPSSSVPSSASCFASSSASSPSS